MTARTFARRLRVYDEVKAERDRLADELREIYPTTAALLAELLARIIANDLPCWVLRPQKHPACAA